MQQLKFSKKCKNNSNTMAWSKIGKIAKENVPYEILSTIIVCK